MKYISASEILPEDLIQEIQKYIQGKTLYIPAPKGNRKKWGKDSGQREFLQKRNAEIRQLFQQGENLDRLAYSYCLSHESIKKIVYKREI
ncbi:CD3324 family protein [Paenibacillus qinlingensis]|uniref:Mor family transcriptional regulator n=1 Tax=Paenibacillus qinlingensis TaxID=1837343 RepID=A0ABU1NWI4_9BACL|nr:CD3324 family protein [Paenibacillus qinlingensis]MDR6551795.1 Mor family transcriptional regulator [Paenibacillus qinlingensis]